jgi:hypothetical protein
VRQTEFLPQKAFWSAESEAMEGSVKRLVDSWVRCRIQFLKRQPPGETPLLTNIPSLLMPFGCTFRQRLFRQQALKHVDLPAPKKYQAAKSRRSNPTGACHKIALTVRSASGSTSRLRGPPDPTNSGCPVGRAVVRFRPLRLPCAPTQMLIAQSGWTSINRHCA